MTEIVGYKKEYTMVVDAGYAPTRFTRKFSSEEAADKWFDYMEDKFKDQGGCKLYDAFEYNVPIYAKRESHLDEKLAQSALESYERRERRRERGE